MSSIQVTVCIVKLQVGKSVCSFPFKISQDIDC